MLNIDDDFIIFGFLKYYSLHLNSHILETTLKELLQEIKGCNVCEKYLVNGVRPVLSAQSTAKILIIGQAPGTRVHKTGIPWNDPSGERLRRWMNVDKETFYDSSKIAIVPMGFCYPGKGKSGDLPPRKECAPLWHEQVLDHLPNLKLTLLIGQYAQKYYLKSTKKKTLTATVEAFPIYLPDYLPLVHPSPRNRYWLTRNPWFEKEVVPYLQSRVKELLE